MTKPSKRGDRRWREEEMATAILDYLAEHPQASDSLVGIAEWWITRQQIRVEVDALKNVLNRLVVRGFLEEVGRSEKALYRLKSRERETYLQAASIGRTNKSAVEI